MAPQIAPGRPGNLTTEQTSKLRDMWTKMGEICGITINHANGYVSPDMAQPVEAPQPKAKKSRGFFGGGGATKKEDDTPMDPRAARILKDVVGDDADKHGNTKCFKQALANLTPEQLRNQLWGMAKADHPDALLLRFLRARKWDVNAALVMLVGAMQWRANDVHVDDDIMVHGEEGAVNDAKNATDPTVKKDAEDFLTQLRLGKSLVYGTDKEGRACDIVRARLHKGGEQSEKALERFTVYLLETSRLMLVPPIDTATVIFDLGGFTMANMDYTPLKFMIKCFEANYPESLGTILVYRAPWIFSGIWRIIKPWLDPVVAAKVNFPANIDDLAQFIDKSAIQEEMGGDSKYVYKYVEPVPGENDRMKDTATRDEILMEREALYAEYEAILKKWGETDQNTDAERDAVAKKLAENYWRLDPYIRARSFYDRLGVIGPGGKIDMSAATKETAA